MPTSSPGRPRSAAAERAIVDATLAELDEAGYQGLTIGGVAQRAGVGRPTIYRRWPDKDALVVGALIATVPDLTTPSTGDPVGDLRALATAFLDGITGSPPRARYSRCTRRARSGPSCADSSTSTTSHRAARRSRG
ncbi:hypothetical protein MTP03_34130 [Tsukamurella sp. PLM1]|nr:TetR/AcrR family transcriptional regulator [Tsukamurella sp. PLM1]BDH58474.1 hypothetical protein MTP03_34130 [Tsukamurella sp. PLM1]